MSVYVDEPIHPFGRMLMCHMFADTVAELHTMADRIGIARKWFQNKPGFPHYDVCKSKRSLAVKGGAIQLRYAGEIVSKVRDMRRVWASGPDDPRPGDLRAALQRMEEEPPPIEQLIVGQLWLPL